MIQGAGSNAGKSIIVAGLCRHLARSGLRVAPFKPQNMSNNAAVTVDGGEIGRAQALQALAAGRPPVCDMNPVLLKPESEQGAQIIVQGKRVGTMKAQEYGQYKTQILPKVLESFFRLAREVDFIVVEGAGSPAEVNLRAGDIANMGFAEAAQVPVVLIGDIDRGGVIAQLVGTHCVLPKPDRMRIKGFAINKFRGDQRLFDAGLREIEARTGWTSLGVLPWFEGAHNLPAEDILDIRSKSDGAFKVVVPRLNRIANFDDLDPLSIQPDVSVEIIEAGRALPGDADLVLIPGSKATIDDLAHFRAQGWDIDLHAHVRRGGHVLGICGGYQMLGREIRDDEGIEGPPSRVKGLGLLDVVTIMQPQKTLSHTRARHRESGTYVDGYEIHMGTTEGPDCARAWLEVEGGRTEGAASADGRILGCYVHGLFSADAFRGAFLRRLGTASEPFSYGQKVQSTLDQLTDLMAAHLNTEALFRLAEEIKDNGG